MDKLLIIVQARMGSERFPGKVLAPFLKQPMLLWQCRRVARMQTPHHLIVATAPTKEDRLIYDCLAPHGIDVRAPQISPDNVLGRFQYIAAEEHATEIMRLCGDCPMIDPVVLDALVALHRKRGSACPDLTAIAQEWPDGLDAEIIGRAALEMAHERSYLTSEREHVTPYIFKNRGVFWCETLPCPMNLEQVQWSIDTKDDLILMERLVRKTLVRQGLRLSDGQNGKGCEWQELFKTMTRSPVIEKAMGARQSRNHRYLEQVVAEQGLPEHVEWNELRYGKKAP